MRNVGYKQFGAESLISGHRGKPSNHHLKADFKEAVLSRLSEEYSDFGPTLAAECLLERDKLKVSKETVRQWMIEAGLWKVNTPKVGKEIIN